MHKIILILTLICLPTTVMAELPIGKPAPLVELSGDLGGRLNGESWSSSELTGKVHVLFYTDPDEKDLNNEASEALKAEKFDREKYGSVGIGNMAATWMPNFAINIALKKKQEKYPDTVYVKDMDKTIVKKWNLADDNNDVVLFDVDGTVLFSVDGQLSSSQIEQLISLIRERM